jgi:hypothetical protein
MTVRSTLVFDSDASTSPRSTKRSGAWAASSTAAVHEPASCTCPMGVTAARLAQNDFLAEGHAGELYDLAESTLRELPTSGGHRYSQGPDGIVWNHSTRDGDVEVPLTNFGATIVGHVLEDDGAETRRLYTRARSSTSGASTASR